MRSGSWGTAYRDKPVWHLVIKSVLPLEMPIRSMYSFTNATHIRLVVKRITPHLSAFPEQILLVCFVYLNTFLKPFVIRYAFAQPTP